MSTEKPEHKSESWFSKYLAGILMCPASPEWNIGWGKKLMEKISWELCCLGRKQEHLPTSFWEGRKMLQTVGIPVVGPSTTVAVTFTRDSAFSPALPSHPISSSTATGPKPLWGTWRHSTHDPRVRGWDSRFSFKEPTLLQPGPLHWGQWPWEAPTGAAAPAAVSRSDGTPCGTPTAALSSLLLPQGHVPSPILLPGLGPLSWDLTQSLAQGDLPFPYAHRYQTNTGAKGWQKHPKQQAHLWHCPSQITKQKRLLLSTLNEALNDDPVARCLVHYQGAYNDIYPELLINRWPILTHTCWGPDPKYLFPRGKQTLQIS